MALLYLNGLPSIKEKVPSEQLLIAISGYWVSLFFSIFFLQSVGINDKKILEHNFGRDDGSWGSFWPCD